MQQGKLYEESATPADGAHELKMWRVFHVAQWVFIVLSGIAVFLSMLLVPSMFAEFNKDHNVPALIFTLVTWFGGLGSLVLIAVLFWRLKLRRNVSFDYNFVEDELRVSKVFNGRKRKFLHRIAADHILKIGYCDRPSFEDTARPFDKKSVKYLTPNYEPTEGKFFFYILYSDSIGKRLYIIESREMMLEFLVRAAGMNKFERQ